MSPKVPGHIVEETIEYYKERTSTVPWFVTVEKTVEIGTADTASVASPSYLLNNKKVDKAEYEAFRASLQIGKNFVDERLPPSREGGRGGEGAIWTGKDANGLKYEINEYTLEGESHYSITQVKP